jgi:hypothetical protein
MARKKKSDTEWLQPTSPPPPLFTGVKEKDFVKQVNDELIERVIGQQVAYFSIDIDRSGFHPIYGEAIEKTFLPPVRVYALVKWEGQTNLFTEGLGIDKQTSIEIHFHKRRLTDDQNLFVREGDYVLYGDRYYEIVSTAEPKQLFGQSESKFEIVAKCKRARDSLFAPKFTSNTVPTRRETTSTATPTYGGNGIVRPSGSGGGGGGGATYNVVSTSGNYTITSTDYYIGINTVGGSLTVTLPSAASVGAGKTYIIKDIGGAVDTNVGFVAAAGSDTIDGFSIITVDSPSGAFSLYSDGTGSWYII